MECSLELNDRDNLALLIKIAGVTLGRRLGAGGEIVPIDLYSYPKAAQRGIRATGEREKTCFGKQVSDRQPGKFGDSERKC